MKCARSSLRWATYPAALIMAGVFAGAAWGAPLRQIVVDGSFADWSAVPSYFDPSDDQHDTDHDQHAELGPGGFALLDFGEGRNDGVGNNQQRCSGEDQAPQDNPVIEVAGNLAVERTVGAGFGAFNGR